MENMMTVKEVAAALKVNPRTVRRLIECGDIEAVNVAPSSSRLRRLRVREAEVEAYIKEVGVVDLG